MQCVCNVNYVYNIGPLNAKIYKNLFSNENRTTCATCATFTILLFIEDKQKHNIEVSIFFQLVTLYVALKFWVVQHRRLTKSGRHCI